MGYIDYLNSFNRWLESNALEPVPQLLYFKLLNVFNMAGWPETVQVDNLRIMSMIGCQSQKSAMAARDKLISAGILDYEKGKKGSPGRYRLIPFQHFQHRTAGYDTQEIQCKKYSVKNTLKNIQCKNDVSFGMETGTNTGIIWDGNGSENDNHIKNKTEIETKTPTPPRQGYVGSRDAAAEAAFYDPDLGKVMTAYLNFLPTASPMSIDELTGYYHTLGRDVCIRAIYTAQDERKNSWSYIRGILRRCESENIRSLADWDAKVQRHLVAKGNDKPQSNYGGVDGYV